MSADLDELIGSALDDRELEYQRHGAGRFLVTVPGTARLQTPTWLIVSTHALLVGAFVCRQPDEAHEDVYRFMLRRNAKLYGVHYALDKVGDIHLVGRTPLHAVTADEIDRLLGQVLEAADGDFNTFLRLGFASSIRREYAWRVDRGESLANLAAFESLVNDS
ncbi:YbjN domain-containing protein [Pseudonocardia spinosispora]|uniref:YbjN domain-containing protein n=1 Tax=Pseudonocardia spinosispora TaxID=103441 RepID=UPI0003F91A7E|nr:YbjN domain-containing protein [Pseudonocardia spinosispora]